MNELVAPMLTYAVVMTFTPGPNNISASVLGMRSGFRGSLPYLLGISSGFLLIMLASGFLTDFLTANYGRVAPWLKWGGVIYMSYLALSLFVEKGGHGERESSAEARDGTGAPRQGYVGGLLLQFVNPKGILYGITLYTSFASILTGAVLKTLSSAFFLAALGFVSVSLWALVGSGLSRFLEKKVWRLAFNILMALLLSYSAVAIALH